MDTKTTRMCYTIGIERNSVSTVFRVSEFDERRGTHSVLLISRVPGDELCSTCSLPL